MLVKETEYYTANAVSAPKRKIDENTRKKYNDLKKSKINRNKRILNKMKARRIAALQITVLLFIVGFIIIARDNQVYSMQDNLTNIKSDIKTANEKNESLKVDLLKAGSLSKVKTEAETNLGMQVTQKSNIVKVDFSQNYFAELDAKKADDKNTGFFSKIFNALN